MSLLLNSNSKGRKITTLVYYLRPVEYFLKPSSNHSQNNPKVLYALKHGLSAKLDLKFFCFSWASILNNKYLI